MFNIVFKALLFIFLSPIINASIAHSEQKNASEIDSLLKDEQSELKILRKKIKKQEMAILKAGKKESAALKNLQIIGNKLKLKENF